MNRTLEHIVAAALILVMSVSPVSVLLAQSGFDTQAPVIEHEAIATAQADFKQIFTAQVADNGTLKDIILYHRRDGQSPFQANPMRPIGSSSYYVASLDTDPEDLRTIEYYFQARDEGGNRTVEGFAFDPYQRTLLQNPLIQSDAKAIKPIDTTASNSKPSIRWWHVALGVLAAGAIASASGGSGGNSSTASTAPINITVTGP